MTRRGPHEGSIYQRKGDLDHAAADFDRAIKANARYDVALNNRGMVLKAKGKLEEAVKDFARALAVNSGFVLALFHRGATL